MKSKQSQTVPVLAVKKDPRSMASEAFRTLRTNLQFLRPDENVTTILITSAEPGSGKTTVAANLAVTMAQSGKNVLLMGCDLRKPILHTLFSAANGKGLSSVLAERVSLTEAIVETDVANLRLLPAGDIPPNPAELLESEAMADVLKTVKTRFDYVFLDAAPLLAVSDSVVLATRADGVLLVLGASQVSEDAALQAKTRLERVQADILGVVLNAVDADEYSGGRYYSGYFRTQ